MAGFRVVQLDDIPPRPDQAAGAEWLPLRNSLGVGAFGVNVFRALRAGGELVERHTEADDDGNGHQELYLVVSGAATFEVAGERIAAPAGTAVFVEDPAIERTAHADEPGTTVLAVGAEAGVAFTPSDWEAKALA